MKCGFSLVELSIVLVILGLLTGGILTGQELIRAAELRSVVAEYEQYMTAARAFDNKYFSLPGDMDNATDFWGVASTGTCPDATGVGTETCNGNGDGVISASPAAERFGEMFTFWQHLANAGMIEGSYSGKSVSGSTNVPSDASNSPSSKVPGALWNSLYRLDAANGSVPSQQAVIFDVLYGNSLIIGAQGVGSPLNAIFTPEEAWSIDTKIDDGRPGRGKVHAVRWNDCTDATTFTQFDADYLLANSATLCALLFVADY